MSDKNKSCPECAAAMEFKSRDNKVEYKGQTASVSVEAWWCTQCDEASLHYEALKANEEPFHALKARVDGILTASEVKAVREQLQLSQRKAGSFWEAGLGPFKSTSLAK